MLSDDHATLVSILKTKGHRRYEQPLQLASGELSYDFVDGKEALADWADLELAGRVAVSTVRRAGVEFDAAGGLELGACALAVSVAAAARCRWFFVRKQPKERGTRRWLEGAQLAPGERVLLVEDVVTTGGSALMAYERIVERECTVAAIVTLVDRGDQATRRFAELGVPYLPLVTYRMLGIDRVGPAADVES